MNDPETLARWEAEARKQDAALAASRPEQDGYYWVRKFAGRPWEPAKYVHASGWWLIGATRPSTQRDDPFEWRTMKPPHA